MTCWALAVWWLGGTIAAGDGDVPAYGTHRLLARSATREVTGSSGVAPSHFDSDVFWTHNDHHFPRVYAFRLSADDRKQGVAADLGYIELRGFKPVDWEDLASGPEDLLYAFDGGDNPPCTRSDKRIVRFREPKVDWSQAPRRLSAAVDYLRFEYPVPGHSDQPALRNDQRFDAECLLVHPQTGDMYVVTKRDNQNQPAARVFRLPAKGVKWNTPAVYILQPVADLSAVVGGRTVASLITGGAISPDGKRMLLRDYVEAYEFLLPAGEPFEAIFKQKPRTISLLFEPQGEGICYAANGDLITTSETTSRDPRFPVFTVPAAPRPAAAAARPATRPGQ